MVNEFRRRIKKVLTRQKQRRSLDSMLREDNPILRGWAGYYRYCIGAKRILSALDWYVGYRLWLWLRHRHRRTPKRKLVETYLRASRDRPGRRVWADGRAEQHCMAYVPVGRYSLK